MTLLTYENEGGNMSNQNTFSKVAIFKGKQIRKTIYKNEWWFSISDIIEVLADSADPKQYIKKMRQRDPELNINWGTICTPLEMIAEDGKNRKVNCANTEASSVSSNLFRPPNPSHSSAGWPR
jgi:hypothetical protein